MELGRDSVIAVVGAGAMGTGIAQVAAQAGHRVTVIDSAEAALERSAQMVARRLQRLVERGKCDNAEAQALLGRMTWSASLDSAATADLLIEAIVEDAAVKAALFAKLETLVSPGAVLATNTSSLSIAMLTKTLRHPGRFAGLHFFNPVPAMKLVEVVPGPQTDQSLGPALLALMNAWGKRGVLVRDVPGFIVNRVARPYYAEGFAALSEGVSAAAIDRTLVACGGFRMGPLALADMIGHDVNYAVATSVFEAYEGNTRFRPQSAQATLAEGGRLGRKSGAGVYDYAQELPEPDYIRPGDALPERLFIATEVGELGTLVDLVDVAGIDMQRDPALAPGTMRVEDVVMAFGDGRLLSSRSGIDVLIDHARNLAEAPVLAVTARSDAAASVAAGLAAIMSKQAIALPDRPGQLALRTLAQLANAAADAVIDDVASSEDIDAAMVAGANHPEGPLAWADRFGHSQVATALCNIAEASADAMYLPSPFFGER